MNHLNLVLQRTYLLNWFNNILLLDPRCGPVYDLQLLRKLMVAHDVPLVLPFLCINAWEVSAWGFLGMILDMNCIWSLFRLWWTHGGLVISMWNSRLCCSWLQDLAICHWVLCLDEIHSFSKYLFPACTINENQKTCRETWSNAGDYPLTGSVDLKEPPAIHDLVSSWDWERKILT